MIIMTRNETTTQRFGLMLGHGLGIILGMGLEQSLGLGLCLVLELVLRTRNNIETAPGLIVWQVLALILEMGLSI